ncbi:hypothetical protein H2202_009821 [Exophiala xenobiotica]|nr:hypothetical protein H2202_009821 [Exophiala xenobiotica]KAK5404264.1 hypothetical protein LTR06_009823 [Exophiala xenobiotica]KAK5441792.1 hypothetical protein LTR18_006714 [Exophiala xenobiotica]
MVVEHPQKVKFYYLTSETTAAEAQVQLHRPFVRGDVFEYTTPVNGRRVQTRIVYGPSGNRVMSRPGRPRNEEMEFEMRLDNGPWQTITDPVSGARLGAAGPAQLEESIFKHLGLTTTNTAAGAWGRFDQVRGTTNLGSLSAVRDRYHTQAGHNGMVTATQHRPRAPAAGLANLPVLAPAPPQQQQQQQQQPQEQPQQQQQQYQQQQMQYQFLVQPQQPQQHQQPQQQMQHQWQLQ